MEEKSTAPLTLLAHCKRNVRISNANVNFDEEISILIDSCVLELIDAGVYNDTLLTSESPYFELTTVEINDARIVTIIDIYVKSLFGQQTNDYINLPRVYYKRLKQLQLSYAYKREIGGA